VSIKGILPIYQRFHREETFTLGNIGIYCWIEETRVSAGRLPSELEAGVSYILFPFKNSVSMWKEYSLSVRVVKWEKHFFYGKYIYNAELKKHMYLLEDFHLS
jgi:hypothetical protein